MTGNILNALLAGGKAVSEIGNIPAFLLIIADSFLSSFVSMIVLFVAELIIGFCFKAFFENISDYFYEQQC